MKFKASHYILNSEIKRLSTIMADVMFEKYDNMVDEMGCCTLGYCEPMSAEVQRLAQLCGIRPLENTDERSDQNDDN